MSRGYNWRNTLVDFASISGTLAGFCIAFIGLILGWSIADVQIYQGITFGNLATLFFGLATSLFIVAAEFFLHAKNFDVFDLTNDYRDWLKSGFPDKNWDTIWIESSKKARANESYARWCYNFAIFLLFIGLFFAIFSYNYYIAIIVSAIGLVFEIWQFAIQIYKDKKT
jgi:dolichol kinase